MDVLLTMLAAGVMISLIMLGLLGLSSLSRKSLNAKTRYFMWIILLLGLVVPFRPLLGSGIIQVEVPFLSTVEKMQQEPGFEARSEAQKGDLSSSETDGSKAADAALASAEKGETAPFPLLQVLVTLWAIGAAISFAKHFVEYYRFHRIVKRWAKPVTDPYTLESFAFVKARMGLEHKKIDILSVATVSTPMLTGLIKPVVLIPEKAIEDDEMELILEHELTHYKHKDLWVNLLSVCALSIHWFNPILYFCMPMIYGDGESYCDEEVLRNKNVDYRRFYGEVIISMIEVSPQKHSSLSTCFYAKKLNIKKRLFNIMESHGSHKKLSFLSLGLVFCLTVFSGSVIVFGAQAAQGEDGSSALKRAEQRGREASKALLRDEAAEREAQAEQHAELKLSEARAIALQDAGLSAEQVAFVSLEKTADGTAYEIRFHKKNREYDYRIEAKTGEILSFDSDIEGFSYGEMTQGAPIVSDRKQEERSRTDAKKPTQAIKEETTKFEDSAPASGKSASEVPADEKIGTNSDSAKGKADSSKPALPSKVKNEEDDEDDKHEDGDADDEPDEADEADNDND